LGVSLAHSLAIHDCESIKDMTALQNYYKQHPCGAKHQQMRVSCGPDPSPDSDSPRNLLQKSGLVSHVDPNECDFTGRGGGPFPESFRCRLDFVPLGAGAFSLLPETMALQKLIVCTPSPKEFCDICCKLIPLFGRLGIKETPKLHLLLHMGPRSNASKLCVCCRILMYVCLVSGLRKVLFLCLR
jgi:hypothetical protein